MGLDKPFKSELDRIRELVQAIDWYLPFWRIYRTKLMATVAIQASFDGAISKAVDDARIQTVAIFERLLQAKQVRIGHPGHEELDDQDEGRQTVDMIVIHHSSRAEGISLPVLNALHLGNLYLPVYQNKMQPVLNSKNEYQPIYSGHFDEKGKQVFYGYHWKVAQDGTTTRLLPDSAIAWHAGNWGVNKRSVGICIDDDLETKAPTKEALAGVATIIGSHYPNLSISPKTIVGHNEVARHPTVCPGDAFLNGWKLELLALLR